MSVSTSRSAISPAPLRTPTIFVQPCSRVTIAIATRMPQATDGARRKDSRVNIPMPISEPIRSHRYAVSGRNWPKHRPTTSAGPASTIATVMNTTGSTAQAGGPVVDSEVK